MQYDLHGYLANPWCQRNREVPWCSPQSPECTWRPLNYPLAGSFPSIGKINGKEKDRSKLNRWRGDRVVLFCFSFDTKWEGEIETCVRVGSERARGRRGASFSRQNEWGFFIFGWQRPKRKERDGAVPSILHTVRKLLRKIYPSEASCMTFNVVCYGDCYIATSLHHSIHVFFLLTPHTVKWLCILKNMNSDVVFIRFYQGLTWG